MRLLAVSYASPRPDQSSGELRFFTLLSLLANNHDVHFVSLHGHDSLEAEVAAATRLKGAGIVVERGTLVSVLQRHRFDLAILEFYFVARQCVDHIRIWNPDCKVLIDSVDVHFHRLRSQARLTGSQSDAAKAERTKLDELNTYGLAELVIAVSDADRLVLEAEGLRVPIAVVPNVHEIFPLHDRPWGDRLEIIFIGSYKWPPNVDAVIYFCQEVMPLLRDKVVTGVRFRIVGSAPTPEVQALAGDDVEVVGYVDDTAPYLQSSHVSVAPLRYGGGIKGKVGEAMAHGLPVVTTSIGAEGFGFVHGRDCLIADSPRDFADAIARLWRDRDLWQQVRCNGRERIAESLSPEAVRALLPQVLDSAFAAVPQRTSVFRRWRQTVPRALDRHLLWRFKR